MLDMRKNWTIPTESGLTDLFYSKEEEIQSAKDNFDFRRYNTPEGYDLIINGITERCLVQAANNPLRELNDYRKIHCPRDADIKRGYYVQYEGDTWIIDTNVVNVDGAYLSTRMSRCQYLLRWQNKDGRIIERWAYCADQTKYSNGMYTNQYVIVPDNQYSLLLPSDSETKHLSRGMRFVFDFPDVEVPDVYELTNRKVSLVDGTIELSFSIDTFNNERDKFVTLDDGTEAWICDYRESDAEESVDDSTEYPDDQFHIQGGHTLKCGRKKTWTWDAGEDVFVNCRWNVLTDLDIEVVSSDSESITLFTGDTDAIGKTFTLESVTITGELILDSIEITVVDMM